MHVVYIGPNKVLIGVEHGKEAKLTAEAKQKVADIAEKHGLWYEGDGGDIAPNKKIFGSKGAYDGSWDAKFAKQVKGYPSEFLYTLFTNTAINKQQDRLTSPRKSIFASIMDAQDAVGYFKDRNFDASTLRKFLSDCGSVGIDFLAMSQNKATAENVKRFLKAGERLMWPTNWKEYPNKAGKQAQKVEKKRVEFLLSAPNGVYIVGKDHLKQIH